MQEKDTQMLSRSHDHQYPFLDDSRCNGVRDTYGDCDRLRPGQRCVHAVESLAEKLSLSESTAHRHIQKPQGIGVLQVKKQFKKGRQQTNRYTFPTPDWWIEPADAEGCHAKTVTPY